MYYKIYGVMSSNGFHTEVGTANSEERVRQRLLELDPKMFPAFAVTEHIKSGQSAVSISVGWTASRQPISVSGLVEFKPNPMLDFKLAESLFTKLWERKPLPMGSSEQGGQNAKIQGD